MGRKSAVPTIADGTYFIIAVADHFGSVAELKENNNDKSRKIVIGPDLGFSAPTSPASATVGSTITVSETTKNAAGASPAGASTTRVYLSLDNKFSSSDTLLSSRAVPALGPNGTSAFVHTVNLPAGVIGARYIIAVADAANAVAEAKETNNTKAKAISITP